jgi:hypothetical protein
MKQWSRVHGTVYGLRTKDTKGRTTWLLHRLKTPINYVGKWGASNWEERVRQHLYGGGQYSCKPKDWADLVPGYDRNARTLKEQRQAVKAVIAVGGAVRLWHGECFYWYLKVKESVLIVKIRPAYNILENAKNPNHIPKWQATAERKKRDRARAYEDSTMFARISRKSTDSAWERWTA